MPAHAAEHRALLAPLLLLLLAERPDHGYALAQRLSAFQSFDCPQSDSPHVYRVLRGLEKDGHIASHWSGSNGSGPPRRTYEITPAGSAQLAVWCGRLEELHGTLHQVLQRYARLPGVTARSS